VTDPSDDVHEMPTAPLLDDATIDAILDGEPVPRGVGHLAAFASGVRACGEWTAPRPSPALTTLLAHGSPARARNPVEEFSRRPSRRSVLAKVAGLSLAAKIAVGTTAVAASVVGAGAAGVLPGGVDRAVRGAIEVVTPVEFTDRTDRLDGDRGTNPSEAGESDAPNATDSPSLPGEHGDRVSSDATGESDGQPGVDGPTVAEQAPGAANRPIEPPPDTPPTGGTPGGTGDTPAGTAPGVSPPSTTPPQPTPNEPTSHAPADASGGTPSPAP
jgi:hypothetical protein